MEVQVEFPRRRAMLEVYETERRQGREAGVSTGISVPVFVWPMPTQDGKFIVEHQD